VRLRSEFGINERDQPVPLAHWRIEYTLRRNAILISKGVGMQEPVCNISLTGM